MSFTDAESVGSVQTCASGGAAGAYTPSVVAPSPLSRTVYKSLRRDIRGINDPKKMTEYLFENEEDLALVPTRILNTWLNIKDYHFKKRRGVLQIMPAQKQAVRTLQDQVNELRNIIKILIANNNLRLTADADDVDDQNA
jgi:hypothetical protein